MEKKDISFISVNNKDILKINNNNLILIGELNIKNNFYNIEQILYFENSQYLNNEFNHLIKMDIDNYYNNRLMMDKNNDISPIISNSAIIGYSYHYNDNIKDYFYLKK